MECDGHFLSHLLESRVSSLSSIPEKRACSDASHGPNTSKGPPAHSILEFPCLLRMHWSEQADGVYRTGPVGGTRVSGNAKEEGFSCWSEPRPVSEHLASRLLLGQQQQRRKARDEQGKTSPLQPPLCEKPVRGSSQVRPARSASDF